MAMRYDIAVVGGGPAGLSAAINARARGKSVVVIANPQQENPLYRAKHVENYLGMPGATGAGMLKGFAAHAQSAGVDVKNGKVLSLMPMGDRFYLSVGTDVEEAGAVILAGGVVRGAKYPGESEYLGKGVSYCATCDGMLYRGKAVAVVGKTPQAPDEAEFLRELGCKVTYVDDKRPAGLSDEITFMAGKRLEILGDKAVTALLVDGTPVPCEGVFILRATIAPSDLLPDLALDGAYIAVDREMKTNVPGVFAAGDCTGPPLQVSKAVGEGLVAGQKAAEYVEEQKK